MSTKEKKKDDKEPFEKSLVRLEEIVEQLEGGEKGLEEALALFEQGVGLSKDLSERLEEVKHRVELLTKSSAGKFTATEVDEEE